MSLVTSSAAASSLVAVSSSASPVVFKEKPGKDRMKAPASDRVMGHYKKKNEGRKNTGRKNTGRRAAVVSIPKLDQVSYLRSSRTLDAIIKRAPGTDIASLFNKVKNSVKSSQVGLTPLVNKMITCINTHNQVLEGIQEIKSRDGKKYVLRSLQGLKFTEIDMLNFSFIEANNDSENRAKPGIKEKIFFFKSDIAQINSKLGITHRGVMNAPSLSVLSSSTINGTSSIGNASTTNENPFLLEYFFDEKDESSTESTTVPYAPYYGIGEGEFLFLRKRECTNSFFTDEYIVDENCNLLYVRCVVNKEIATYNGNQLELFRVTFMENEIKVRMITEDDLGKVQNPLAKSAYNKFRNTYSAIFNKAETDVEKLFNAALLEKFIKRLVYPSAKNVVKRFINAALHHIRGGQPHKLGNTNLSFDIISNTINFANLKTDDFEFQINHALITTGLGEESLPDKKINFADADSVDDE